MKTALDLFVYAQPIDAGGYEVVETGQPNAKPSERTTLLTGPSSHRVLRGRGGAVRWVRPRVDFPALHRELAQLPSTEDAALTFTRDRGLLFQGSMRGGQWREEVPLADFFAFQANLRELLERVDASDRVEARRLLNERTNAQFMLRVHPQEAVLQFEPRDLASYLVLCLAEEVAEGRRWQACAHCGDWIDVGPQSRRRRDTRFCSDSCRVLAHRARKAQEAPK